MDSYSKQFVILGPCVIESEDHAHWMARSIQQILKDLSFDLIFKASFEKANRTSIESYTGPGMDEGIRILGSIRSTYGLRVITDVHESQDVEQVAGAVDVLQIPAFLTRQTRLLEASARTGLPVNVKKAQFMSGYEMAKVVEKLFKFGAIDVILTERGTMFGYNNLVVDFRNLVIMKSLGVRTCIDATHSVQLPGANGASSGGQRQFVPTIARAAAAVGVDGFFFETHDNPDQALSDGPNMVPLGSLENLLRQVEVISGVQKSLPQLPFERSL